jgi:hypothetical protein
MLKSLKEYATALGHWVWVVILEVLGSAVGAYLDISNTLSIPIWLWLTFLLLGLIIAPFLAFHKIRKERDVLQEKLDNNPFIEVEPHKDFDDYYLKVHNIGGYAQFEAQVKVTNGVTSASGLPALYTACWRHAQGRQAQIMCGLIDEIKIASTQYHPIGLMHFRLYFFDTKSEQIRSVDSTSWIPGSNQVVKPEFIFQVTISSLPSLKEKVFVRNYKLDSQGLKELPQG